MNIPKNKIIKTFLLVISLIGTIFSIQNVKAETYTGQAIWPSEHISNIYIKKERGDGYIKYQQARFIRRSEDNKFVYCLQPYVEIDNNLPYYNIARRDYASVLNMSQAQWERVSLLAYYGYGYGNHTDHKWYAITQVLIWRTVEPTSDIYFTDTLNGTKNSSKFASEIAEIESLISNHYKAPNLNVNDLVIPLGQTVTLNDSNGVLNQYNVKSQENVQATISGNTINIKATGIGSAKLTLEKKDKVYNENPIVYYSNHSQNVMRVGSYDPLVKSFNMKIIGGRVEIVKKDFDNGLTTPQGQATLKGAVYGVYDAENNELITQLTTDDNSYAISDYLPKLGQFYIKEISPSTGYNLDDQKYYFTLDENTLLIKVDVFEKVIKRNFEFTKILGSNKTGIMTSEVGSKFAIYDINGNLISEEITNEEGKIHLSLPYGKYTLKQLTSPDGYELMKDYQFEVKEEGKTINKVFSNAEITSRLKVIKIDDSGNSIAKAGIKFKIKDLYNNKYICQTVSYPTTKTYCEYETNEEGILITPYPLNSGDYQLEELDQYIDGYLWNKEPLKFSINNNSNIYSSDEFDAILDVKFVNKEVKGNIELIKYGEKVIISENGYKYEEIKLANIEFGLYDLNGNLIAKTKTDENGKLVFSNLKLGTYKIKELSTIPNHVISTEEYTVELKYKDQYTEIVYSNLDVKNYLIKGDLEFTKTDLVDGKVLPDTKIQVYTENDELIFEGITDENGQIKIKELFIGKFYIIETEPSTGYTLNEEKVFFEIKENGEIVKANMSNEKIKGTLHFTKTDFSESKGLPNTKIQVYTENDELIFEGITDENGIIIIENIEYGKYYILEKEAPEGYILSTEKMYFEILEDGQVIKATMKNEEIVEVPNTNKEGLPIVPLSIVGLVLGIGLLIYGKKKK